MNTVYYLVGMLGTADEGLAVTGGHGFTYDSNVVSKKRLSKNVPTPFGYYVESEHQNIAVEIQRYLSGRAIGKGDPTQVFLLQLEALFNYHRENKGKKILITTNMPAVTKAFIDNSLECKTDGERLRNVFNLYEEIKEDVIFNFLLYPKGGIGVKHAHDQANMALMVGELISEPNCVFEVIDKKAFDKPNIEFNKLVTATRWFFNTGDDSKFYELVGEDRRVYFFGGYDTTKKFYGKATPDIYYSALFTSVPVKLLDKLYDFCRGIKDNPYNHLLVGNLTNITSREIARTIDMLPAKFEGNMLVTPMKISNNDGPCLVELLNPPGLSYRIKDKTEELKTIYRYFINRNNENWYGKTQFLDITERFFINDGKKIKFSPEFSPNTLRIAIPVDSPKCVKPVTINLSVKYDCPTRNALNSMLKDGVTDIKIYLVLDFSNEGGVVYSTITSTPEFDYLHTNSAGNVRVYSLRELGR